MQNRIRVLLMLLGYGLIMGIIGFVVGRCTVNNKTSYEVRRVQLPPIHDSISMPVPYKVEVPSDPEYIYKHIIDTIVDSVPVLVDRVVIDTSAIVMDWSLKRSYNNVLFDNDSLGKIEVISEVQYNQLRKLEYTFNPIQTVITKTIVNDKKVELLGGAGITTNGLFNIQAGIFTRGHLGFSYQYTRDPNNNRNYHGLNVLLKY